MRGGTMKQVLISIMILTLLFSGCATVKEHEKTAIGAGVGAAAGAGIGYAIGGGKGAAIGAAAGGILGAIIGTYIDRQIASRAEAAKKYQYNAKKEEIKIETSSIIPEQMVPGSEVKANVQYTVLSPAETQQMNITETRTLIGKEPIKLGERNITRAQGTHLSTFKFTLPQDIEKGDYKFVTTVSDGSQKKHVENQIIIL